MFLGYCVSLLVFNNCICNGLHRCHNYKQTLCCLLPFCLSDMYRCVSLFQGHVSSGGSSGEPLPPLIFRPN